MEKRGDQMGPVELKVLVDKRGRTFEVGEQFMARPGVVVAGIRRVGNFITVSFGPREPVTAVPGPITMHTDDVMAFDR